MDGDNFKLVEEPLQTLHHTSSYFPEGHWTNNFHLFQASPNVQMFFIIIIISENSHITLEWTNYIECTSFKNKHNDWMFVLYEIVGDWYEIKYEIVIMQIITSFPFSLY